MLRWAYLQPLTKWFHGRTQVFLLELPPFESLDSHAPQGLLDPFNPLNKVLQGTRRDSGEQREIRAQMVFSRGPPLGPSERRELGA